LRKLLDTHIESFEKLELLMFLRRAPGASGTVGEVASAIGLGNDEVRTIAAQLMAAGLVTRSDGSITLAPRSPEDRAALEELGRVYDDDKIVLVKVIAETAMDRLRNLAGRAFAEAFVIRKKPGGSDG
jgi:DNA-binding IclR family transcriptional regulator